MRVARNVWLPIFVAMSTAAAAADHGVRIFSRINRAFSRDPLSI
jgi:hypothetical protein